MNKGEIMFIFDSILKFFGLNSSKQNNNEDNDLNSSEIKIKKSNNSLRVARDVQESIPYKTTYPALGIIEDYDGYFSKTYKLDDCNFGTVDEDRRDEMFEDYGKVLNTVAPGSRGQLLIFNRTVDSDTVRNNVLFKPRNDGANDLREEWNDQILSMMNSGRNNLKKDKYFTISMPADNIHLAKENFKDIDKTLSQNIRRINDCDTKPLRLDDRLEAMYDIYHPFDDFPFAKKMSGLMKGGHIDYDALSKAGISTKDLIGPDSIDLYAKSYAYGDTYTAAFYIDKLPSRLSTDILDRISNLSCNMLLSVTFEPLDNEVALNMVKNKNTGINTEIATVQKENKGLDYIPTELENAKEQTRELLSDMTRRDQKLFKTTILCILMAPSKKKLEEYSKSLKTIVSGTLCQCRSLANQEELAFNTALPLALNQVALDRILTTEEASVFVPFTVQEIYQPKGVVYGLNAISKNIIRYDRASGDSYGGIILGKTGSGKSYIAKEELLQLYLDNPNDRFIIIDPENEFSKIAEALGGVVITFDSSNKYRLNPFDLDLASAEMGENPIVMKADFIVSLVETMVGGEDVLSIIDKNLIHRAIRKVYQGYYQYMKKEMLPKGITIDKEAMPTFSDLYEELARMGEPSAQIIASAIENYCSGGIYDSFSYRTNINIDKRLVVYNTSKMPEGLKELAPHICLNDAWNRMVDNSRKYKECMTHLYIDEGHLFCNTSAGAKFIKQIALRARKYSGRYTIMTQNLIDLMKNSEAQSVVRNIEFMIMMKQSPTDVDELADMYDLSPTLQSYLNRGRGTGLIWNGSAIIPFENEFYDKTTRSHQIMESNQQKAAMLEEQRKATA